MRMYIVIQLTLLLLAINKSNGVSSPLLTFTTYKYATELQANIADLWWTIDDDEREIMFELHIKTTGWIALGISPAGGMKGADIGVGWVDQTGKVHFQDRYALNYTRPVIDNTTTDWFAIQGREENGWTAIQFKRLLDTCDTMDVPIKSGTNILIFAYGLVDPDMCRPDGDISYHDNRRGSRILPLRSYGNPPSEDKFSGLDSFEFRLNNYVVPSTDTTHYCKVFKAPSGFSKKRHAIAYETLIDSVNRDLVHHMILYECDPAAKFDDSNLPDNLCDHLSGQLSMCLANIATVWAVGGDHMVEFTKEAGYPVGGDFPIKYYLVQMRYDNPRLKANRTDSSGIRFYVGNELRKHDLGHLTFGVDPSVFGLAIPPEVDRFVVDSYCLAKATAGFPESGITVVSAFLHTHLQGQSIWTKLIRNRTAVQYLFNGEAYDFNYQFENRLPKPITLYPGDEFATRCVYNTMNKKEITLGGERTKDEMCFHIFTYYPRMNDLYACMTTNSPAAWQSMVNETLLPNDHEKLQRWLLGLQWTPELAVRWQEFYDNASRILISGRANHFSNEFMPSLPKYEDLKPVKCQNNSTQKDVIGNAYDCNSAVRRQTFVLLVFISFIMNKF